LAALNLVAGIEGHVPVTMEISRNDPVGRSTTMSTAWTTFESPHGVLTLTGGNGVLRRLYFHGQAPSLAQRERDPASFAQACAQLAQYFAGERRTFELDLDFDGVGTAVQRSVWRALQRIPYGETTTYGRLAGELGIVGSGDSPPARIAGAAIARTPIPIVVPCHRVVASTGALTGYLGGLRLKQALLELEGADAALALPRSQTVRQQLSLL
jgi:methylated-DNA-[protein]-cysteine S-methyltransferase